jgi:acyl carrier protein
VNQHEVEERVEAYVRSVFDVSPSDPGFDRTVDLFERGYIDSIGFVELLEFIREDFGVEVPEEMLVSDDFTRVEGIARIICRLAGSA